jgi:nucleotide-binding universal stress UspA family protein
MALEFENILVPISGGKIDKQAIELACSLTKKKGGHIFAIHIVQIDQSLPLDVEATPEISRAETILSDVEEFVEDLGYDISVDLFQAREVGPAIVEEAKEHHADLILIGLPPKICPEGFRLGEVVPYLLENAPCRVIVYYQPATGEEC